MCALVSTTLLLRFELNDSRPSNKSSASDSLLRSQVRLSVEQIDSRPDEAHNTSREMDRLYCGR